MAEKEPQAIWKSNNIMGRESYFPFYCLVVGVAEKTNDSLGDRSCLPWLPYVIRAHLEMGDVSDVLFSWHHSQCQLCMSLSNSIQWCHITSLKLDMVGIFILWNSANAAKQVSCLIQQADLSALHCGPSFLMSHICLSKAHYFLYFPEHSVLIIPF